MHRPFNSGEAKELIYFNKTLKSKLSGIIISISNHKIAIKQNSESLVQEETEKILNNISIEEINRDKKGLRIKLLQSNGYNTISDIYKAPECELSSIHGISEYNANIIKNRAKQIASDIQKNTKIKLNIDNKTHESTKLVVSIHRYILISQLIEECKHILYANGIKIDDAIKDLSIGTNFLKWFLSFKIKKQKAIEAYKMLTSDTTQEYHKKSNALLETASTVNRCTNEEAWDNFSNNPIDFFSVLEGIVPQLLGTDDAFYGLPQNLAQEIKEELFSTEGLLCELRRYQVWGVQYALHQKHVLLGDEMGLGKTIQAIAAMVSLLNTGATRFVVVCPASIITNWCREITKMSILKVIKVHGFEKYDAYRLWIATGGVAITTYETACFFKLEDSFKISLLVVDEAHYIKNPNAQRSNNVKNLLKHAERTLFMTGTALENKVEEMIALTQMLQPDIASQIRGMTFISSASKFREKIAPVYYRRKREDVLTELPELIENHEWCTLLPEEEQLYEQSILNKHYNDARRVSWIVSDLNNSCKARRLLEIIEESESDGRKIIVFSFFLDTIRKIKSLLGDRCLIPINGSVAPNHRQEIIDQFNEAPAGTVLVAQIQTGGTGLNIQTASVVVICEPQFKPSTENQAISRAYRMGQTRNVLVYRLLCEATVDERITSILENKQAVFDAFADKSVAAAKDMIVDDKTFGNIIREEIARINTKYQKSTITNS